MIKRIIGLSHQENEIDWPVFKDAVKYDYINGRFCFYTETKGDYWWFSQGYIWFDDGTKKYIEDPEFLPYITEYIYNFNNGIDKDEENATIDNIDDVLF